MKVYFWRDKPNFGDWLAIPLLKRYANVDAEWAPKAEADYVVVGSLLDFMPDDWAGTALGVGMLHASSRPRLSKARIEAVRGPLTASALGRPNVAIGDSGLLADGLLPTAPDRDINLGLVPHRSDHELAKRPEFLRWNPIIIDVADDPIEVVRQIGRCKKIVASSLHGLIVADSFGIPRRFEPFPSMTKRWEGGYYKFLDYHESIEFPFEVGVTKQAHWNRVEDRKSELFDLFRSIKDDYS